MSASVAGDSNPKDCHGELVFRASPINVEWGSAPTDALTRSIFQFCLALGNVTISAKGRVFVYSLYPPLAFPFLPPRFPVGVSARRRSVLVSCAGVLARFGGGPFSPNLNLWR